jgi:hypothetical protein
MTANTVASYIKVILRPEMDGFYAHSADLPGLSVWGASQDQVQTRVKEAVRVLYRLNHGYDVSVRDAADPLTLELRNVSSALIVAREAA